MIAAFTRFDLSSLFSTPARIIAPLAFVAVAGILSPLPLLAIPAAAAVTSLGVGTPFLNDERGRLDVLYVTLPISRTTVVIGRYLVMMLWFIAAAVIGTASALITTAARNDEFQFGTFILVLALTFCAAALALAVQIPVFFAFGFARARTAMFIPVIVLAVVCSAAAGLGALTSDFLIQAANSALTPVIALAVGILGLTVSAWVASRVYQNRQF